MRDLFEPYSGPSTDDGFEPVVTNDLKAFLRNIEASAKRPLTRSVTTVTLANGATAQIIQTSGDAWELVIHLGRDFYKVFSGRSRDEVLRMAGNADGINH
jgi:hypothetical protein